MKTKQIHLTDLRREEFEKVKKYFRPEMRTLEIGGGTGYQASLIAQLGVSIESINVALPLSEESYFPVKDIYDGLTLPYEDSSFDVVLLPMSLNISLICRKHYQ